MCLYNVLRFNRRPYTVRRSSSTLKMQQLGDVIKECEEEKERELQKNMASEEKKKASLKSEQFFTVAKSLYLEHAGKRREPVSHEELFDDPKWVEVLPKGRSIMDEGKETEIQTRREELGRAKEYYFKTTRWYTHIH